jgi:hypothetical protein
MRDDVHTAVVHGDLYDTFARTSDNLSELHTHWLLIGQSLQAAEIDIRRVVDVSLQLAKAESKAQALEVLKTLRFSSASRSYALISRISAAVGNTAQRVNDSKTFDPSDTATFFSNQFASLDFRLALEQFEVEAFGKQPRVSFFHPAIHLSTSISFFSVPLAFNRKGKLHHRLVTVDNLLRRFPTTRYADQFGIGIDAVEAGIAKYHLRTRREVDLPGEMTSRLRDTVPGNAEATKLWAWILCSYFYPLAKQFPALRIRVQSLEHSRIVGQYLLDHALNPLLVASDSDAKKVEPHRRLLAGTTIFVPMVGSEELHVSHRLNNPIRPSYGDCPVVVISTEDVALPSGWGLDLNIGDKTIDLLRRTDRNLLPQIYKAVLTRPAEIAEAVDVSMWQWPILQGAAHLLSSTGNTAPLLLESWSQGVRRSQPRASTVNSGRDIIRQEVHAQWKRCTQANPSGEPHHFQCSFSCLERRLTEQATATGDQALLSFLKQPGWMSSKLRKEGVIGTDAKTSNVRSCLKVDRPEGYKALNSERGMKIPTSLKLSKE